MSSLVSINATTFFNRTSYLYAIGDFKINPPLPLNTAAYIILFMGLWTVPFLFIVGIYLNPWYIGLIILPPILLGTFATKNIFGGKNLMDFLNTLLAFSGEPKGWMDGENNNMKDDYYTVKSEIWVSRRRELQQLARLAAAKKNI